MYWLVRGAQSALFYYTSCTPCIERARKRKIRAETKRERQALQLYQPTTLGEYHMQPEPFTTNPYWEADFACPNTPRPGRSQRRSRKHASSNVSKSAPLLASDDNNNNKDASRNMHRSPELRPQVSLGESLTVSTSSTWDRKQNQREDDEVWGFEYTDGSFHTGPARPHSRSETARSLLSPPKSSSREPGASSFLSPPSLHGDAQPQKTPSGQDSYSSPPYMADINYMAPPVVAFPDEYQNGNAWFRQPPADRGVMRNTSTRPTSISARSRPSTRGKDSDLIRQVSNRMLSAQLQSADLLALPGPALSRSSTQRSTYRPRATLDAAEEEAIPDILDDDYVPRRLSTATKGPSSLHSSKSLRRPSQQKELHESRGTGTSTGSTVLHNLPSYSSEDTSMDADVEDSDADSGIDIDHSPDSVVASPSQMVKSSQTKRQRPSRTTTDPFARRPKAPVHSKSYLLTTGPPSSPIKPKAHQQDSMNQFAPRGSMSSHQQLGDLPKFGSKFAGISVNAEEDAFGEGDLDEEEDPRWTWTRTRRWSADL